MATAPQVRTGRVSSIDYKHGTYEVVFADRASVSCTINAQSNGEYKMPEIGQTVSCTMNGNGTVAGATLGTVWNQSNQPAEGYKGLYRKEYGRVNGDSYERYDANTGEYTQYCRTKTGRNSNGVIYDECKGAYTARSGGAMMLRSTGASVGITAASGVGITAGAAVDLQATTYASVTTGTMYNVECGTDYTMTVGGKGTVEITGAYFEKCLAARRLKVDGADTESYNGVIQRYYNAKLTEKVSADWKVTVEANVEREVTGDVKHTVTGNVTQEVTGDTEQTLTGNVTQNIEGDVTQTVNGNVTLTVGGATITVSSGGDVSVSAPNVTVNGAAGDVKVDGISLVHHKHKDGGQGEPEK